MNDAILDGLSWCKWARSCILTSHVIKRLHIWQVKLRISDRWCHSQSMQRAFPVRAMVITLSEICMNFAVKIVFLLCFGALVRSDYWQVWTTRPKPQWTRLWRSDVELFEHCCTQEATQAARWRLCQFRVACINYDPTTHLRQSHGGPGFYLFWNTGLPII